MLADVVTSLTFCDQSEIYHPLVLASMACEMKLRMWHGSRSHRQQVRRLRGHADGCGTRPKGSGGSLDLYITSSCIVMHSVFFHHEGEDSFVVCYAPSLANGQWRALLRSWISNDICT